MDLKTTRCMRNQPLITLLKTREIRHINVRRIIMMKMKWFMRERVTKWWNLKMLMRKWEGEWVQQEPHPILLNELPAFIKTIYSISSPAQQPSHLGGGDIDYTPGTFRPMAARLVSMLLSNAALTGIGAILWIGVGQGKEFAVVLATLLCRLQNEG